MLALSTDWISIAGFGIISRSLCTAPLVQATIKSPSFALFLMYVDFPNPATAEIA